MAGLVALEKMAMLVILMLVGYGAAKARWVDTHFSAMTSRLVTNVFLPATILASVVGVEPSLTRAELALVIGASFLMFAIIGVLGWLLMRLLPLAPQERTVGWLSILFMNNIFIGLPVVEAIFGEGAVFCASLTNVPFNLLLYTMGIHCMRRGQAGNRGRLISRELFTPALIATLLAVVIFCVELPIPTLLGDTITTLGAATVPLSMLIIGISLSRIPIRRAVGDWRPYAVCLVRLILCPLAVWLLLRLVMDGVNLGVLTTISACPSAAILTILCVRYGVDDRFASRVNFLSTILCAITLPLMTFLLF